MTRKLGNMDYELELQETGKLTHRHADQLVVRHSSAVCEPAEYGTMVEDTDLEPELESDVVQETDDPQTEVVEVVAETQRPRRECRRPAWLDDHVE